MPKPNNLIVISVDALNKKDFSYLEQLDVFHSFRTEGSYVRSVDSIYPSLTYPCHTAIITGTYPDKNGIFHNEIANPKRSLSQDWNWHKQNIKVPTLPDYATKAGLSCASFLWPVMAKAGHALKYNVPEIFSPTGRSNFSLFLENGTKKILPSVYRFSKQLRGISQPYLDNFTTAISSHIIATKKPNLTLIHLTELDSVRHHYGLFSAHAYQALNRMNRRINTIIDQTKANGTFAKTNFVILGDHGGDDFHYVISLNQLFKQHGLLQTDAKGTIQDYTAYANTCGGSCQIVLKRPTDSDDYRRVYQLLKQLAIQPGTCIRALYTRQECRKFHLFGDFSFMLEAKPDYIFKNEIFDQLITDRSQIRNCYRLDHGYLPSNDNLKTLLFMKGPDIRKGCHLAHCNIVDEGPTFAKLLHLTMENVDGRVLEELIL